MSLRYALLLLLASCAVTPTDDPTFSDACRLSGYDCRGVEPPIVRFGDFTGHGSVTGAYFGGNIIYVSEALKGYPDMLMVTLAHEFTHHLQASVGKIPSPTSSALHLCLMEQEAYRVQSGVALEIGRPDLAADADNDPRCGNIQPSSKVIQ